jgi:integrase
LAWPQVRRILQAIDVQAPLGRRDFAMFLMMVTYGMGAGEIVNLRLADIDWHARTIRVRRPKTGTVTILPILAPIARALAGYLRNERPIHAEADTVFVSHRMPHAALGGSGPIRHRLAEHAAAAGVTADFLGSHVFRHTHATRQIESGVAPKIVSDVLGHRRPESTSVYVRSALLQLRGVALPVPR